ncbi:MULTISPECIES: hydroxyphenylacetyl-CoA thioesterase PaaI [Chromobacterium]|nr:MULTISPECIES: hydroxyphenylacetyl-CoA thioesterase PaaI [Chromobacterium]MBK0415553.1 hydroxyphenylacetyl-CoA thioesterase PaaI [Chromobacterium haemolyticum]MBO0415027.1 hydroxyphenylacetyl-CoA thioesterase PaaI [Chromobacterium haemolyticum]MBO0498288.1 hydroxyphenylacetyl-CoA thioesterase PaaI [Chromobacterium haemolyticum]MDH0340425.1 hydroxyphenylacetyl-CoA thioesterase PaaI [Chromobacterium haemolyticum]OQS35103.1 phenylacetic acid degradation protein PaaD [Chromobacterium haemolyticu
MTETESAGRLAEHSALEMLSKDRASASLGMELLEVAPGRARMRMRVRDDMLNGFQLCHGGLLCALADTAFAVACNSWGPRAVGVAISMEYLLPAHSGDCLLAEAECQHQGGRQGLYDVRVSNQRGETLVLLRGRSHRSGPKAE